MKRHPFVLVCLLCVGLSTCGRAEETAVPASGQPVSFHATIRPILQAHCQGCHQPAKAGGGYVMTSFDRLLRGGESDTAAIVPGNPDDSYLLELVTPENGTAEMPQGQPPLSDEAITLIRQWIAEGAQDDSPATAQRQYDLEHPPVYTAPPVVTSIDSSPDGRLLAVAGFHEVLLHKLDGSGLAARLIGVSERIESIAFSPDGTRLAVAGGLPARGGEVQVWDVSPPEDADNNWQPTLLLSIATTFDTVYGGRWSPDGKLISVGGADNVVRAFNAETGAQVLFQGVHNDWVLDTVFSVDGTHLVSVGRDMTARLTEVATERFVDNITSITPGALKGGISAVVRHPQRDEIVIGGADGVPKVYRMFRQTERRIGDDANLIRRLPEIRGRVFAVAVSADGKRIASGSSLDGRGQIGIDSYEFDTSLPEDIKQINAKVSTSRSAEEVQRLEDYLQSGVKRIALIEVPAGVYALDFLPDGKTLAAAGADGLVRLFDVESGNHTGEFLAAPVTQISSAASSRMATARIVPIDNLATETIPEGTTVTGLDVAPKDIRLTDPFDYIQLVVTATLDSGEKIDATRMVSWQLLDEVATVSRRGTVRGTRDGQSALRLELAGQAVDIPIAVYGFEQPYEPDFIRDVSPVIAKLGCNQGTCHGAAQGKNGFKLSLRGYDPIADLRAFTDDLGSRRANTASPDDSLMLLKASGTVPHVGGQLTKVGEAYYDVIRDWLAGGARLNQTTPRVQSIGLYPVNPVVETLGAQQQIRVIATFADGQTRDVTREAFITSGNTEIATADSLGLMTAVRRGEAPVLARYQGAYAATTLTVMGDRSGFTWEQPPANNRIDLLTANKWSRLKIQPSELCTDAEFIRRVYLDLTGLPPTAEATRAFMQDARDTRTKRDELIGQLVGSDNFVDFWTNKWSDLLQVNRKFLGPEGAAAFHDWIRQHVAQNTPYDQFVKSIVTATGSNRENPAASYFKIMRTPTDTLETTTQLFLAIRFNCNKCHDHPFERWTQDQYYQTAAYFAKVGRQPDPESKGRTIGGSAVEGATPYYEIVADQEAGEVVHDRTGQVTPPVLPYNCTYEASPEASRRDQFAAWLTSADNPYFARSYVNRLWGYLLGVGIIEPIDDIRAGNPPSNPELLDYLTDEFVTSGFDTRHVMRLICSSRTYQLSVATNPWNEDDRANYSHALARRLPAEVLFDALHAVTGAIPKIPGVPEGTRAVQLPDAGIELPSGFLSTLGKPVRESACECERSNDIQLGPVMAMVSGPVVATAIADPISAIAQLAATETDDRKLTEEIFLRVLNRPVREDEIVAVQQLLQAIETDNQEMVTDLASAETAWVARRQQLDTERQTALATAEADLESFRQQIAPQVAQREEERTARIGQAEEAIKKYEAELPTHFDQWAEKLIGSTDWHPLMPETASASNGALLRVEDDRSVRAEGKADKGVYTVTFRTHLRNITGLRFETLPVEGLPGGGPGLPPNGNFVVTEFEVQAASTADPAKLQPVALSEPQADFTQPGFDIQQAINGATQDQQGWAVHPAGGTVHWATFRAQQPIDFPDGIVLQVTIHQFHEAADHRLARFRVSVTSDPTPAGLSLPESLAAAYRNRPQGWSQPQQQLIADYWRKTNPQHLQLQTALAEAQRPVPIDPGLSQRQSLVAQLKEPIADVSALVQLRTDAQQSELQLANKRLTAAQDLVWALINSPEFLFNH